MKRVKAVFPIFFLFIILSFIIFFFFQKPMTGGLQTMTLPVQQWMFGTFEQPSQAPLTPQQKLQQENDDLRTQLAKMQEIQRDNQALHDQFQVSKPSPKQLLPAMVVGVHEDALIIDKGTQDKIKEGDIVVVKDNLIGRIIQTSGRVSVVSLITNPDISFTAKTAKTNAVGVVKSQDDSLILDNVVLSDKLEMNDLVLTKGDQDAKGAGFPPDLVVGKIISVNKQPSNLFQAAKIQPLVDIGKVRMVFVEIK